MSFRSRLRDPFGLADVPASSDRRLSVSALSKRTCSLQRRI